MSSKLLKSFVIGSSFLAFFHFFTRVSQVSSRVHNYSYQAYSLAAPVYLGLMNVLGGIIFPDSPYRFIYTGLISGLIAVEFSRTVHSYNFTPEEWDRYTIRVILLHLFTFAFIIAGLERLLP